MDYFVNIYPLHLIFRLSFLFLLVFLQKKKKKINKILIEPGTSS